MRLVKPSFEIIPAEGARKWSRILQSIERAGRTCYKSEDKITEDSAKEFCRKIIARWHLSVIEHESFSVRFVIDRGVSHELVRHRLCAFSQESTRYCNYSGGVTFVIPPWVGVEPGEYDNPFYGEKEWWFNAMLSAESYYMTLLDNKWTPQQARSVLPNSLKTEIVVTANLREWRHIFTLRTSKAAHPQMQEIMRPLLDEIKKLVPVIYDDIDY